MGKKDMTRKAIHNKSFRNSIQAKITLIIILTSTVVFAAFAFYDYFVTSAEMDKDFDNLAEYIANQQSKSLALPLWYMDSKSVKDVMSSAMIEKQVHAVLIRDESGIVYGEMRDNNLSTVGISKEISGDYYVKKKEISKNDEKLGSVEVYLTPIFMLEKLNDTTVSMLITLIILNMSLVLVLFFIIRKSVILPVSHVAENVRTIASGHLDRSLHLERTDEIGQLASDVESMRLTMKENLELILKQNETLRESEERFRAIATNTPDHILIQDKDLRYVWVLNPQLGLTEKDMIGKTDFDITSKEDAAILTEIKTRVLGTGNPEFVKVPLVSLKGDTQHFEGTYIPRRDQEGKIDGLIGYFRNMTDRVKGEKALKESEERYRKLLENVLVGVYQVTLDGKPIFANQKMVEIFGYSSYEELIAIGSIAELYARPEERYKIVDEIISKGFINEEVEFRHKDGQSIWIKLHTRKTTNKEGAIILEGLMEDVTEKKKLVDQLHRAQKMESLGLLAGGVAHDLNNILSGIVSYPELLLMDLPKDSPLRKPIETIKESGMRAADVVEELLTIARGVATGKEALNLNTIVTGYLGSAEHQKLGKTHSFVNFKTALNPDLLNMSGSPTHIRKILMNLMTNASEAIEGSGTVTISTRNQYLDEPLKGYEDVRIGEYAVLIVSDDGSGISSQDLERIFEPFYTKKVMGRTGTGLGLAVVWNTVQDHNGYIDVKSSETGTVFELYFPVTRQEVAAQEAEVPLEDYVGHGEKILVVDDEERQKVIACGMLTKLGYNAESVSSGEEAIEYVKEKPVDLIVLDMVMPKGINGRETYEEIIKIRPGQKAVIASGYAKTKEVDIAQRLGAGKYIKKPYTLEKIGLAVKEELEK